MEYVKYFLPWYPQSDLNLAYILSNLVEFQELSCKETIDRFYNHQHVVERFLSPYTPYNGLLVYHGMGTGKTCSVFLVLYMHFIYNPKFRALILVHNDEQRINFKFELTKCVAKLENLPNDFIVNFGKHIEYETFGKLKGDKMEEIESGRLDVIVIDEVQQIYLQKHNPEETLFRISDVYKSIHSFMLRHPTSKKILLSGTPIIDKFNEFFQVMNLILPHDKQFSDEYTNNDNPTILNRTEDIKHQLIGYISHYISSRTSILRIEGGVSHNNSKTLVYVNRGTKHQSDAYNKAHGGVFGGNQNQALHFVWPDGRTGADGFKHNMKEENDRYKTVRFKSNKTADDVKMNLRKYSIMYYNILVYMGVISDPTILSVEDYEKAQRESCYFYSYLIDNSGCRMLGAVLELFGYRHISEDLDSESADVDLGKLPEAKRYALISSKHGITSTRGPTALAGLFSHPRNLEGKLLKIIIGGDKTVLGYNFKNGRQAHTVIRFNSPTIDQAIARIIRGQEMDHKGQERYVRIFRHIVTLPDTKTLHEDMLSLCERKDVNNAILYRIIDKVAVDCFIHKDVHQVLPDNSKECNFEPCMENFKCYGDTSLDIENPYGNYISFYQRTKELELVKKEIQSLLNRDVKSFHVDDLIESLTNKTQDHTFLLLDALHTLIINQVPFTDRFGFRTYLHLFKNCIFTYCRPLYKDVTELFGYTFHPREVYPVIDPIKVDEAYLLELDKLYNTQEYNTLSPYTQSLLFEDNFPEETRDTDFFIDKHNQNIFDSDEIRNIEYISSYGQDTYIHDIVLAYHIDDFKTAIKSYGGMRIYSNGEWRDLVNPKVEIAVSKLPKRMDKSTNTSVPRRGMNIAIEYKGNKTIVRSKLKKDGTLKMGRDITTFPLQELREILMTLIKEAGDDITKNVIVDYDNIDEFEIDKYTKNTLINWIKSLYDSL